MKYPYLETMYNLPLPEKGDHQTPYLPAHTANVLRNYLEHRLPPGDFLDAVLCNDLMRAVSRADLKNLRCLTNIVAWLYNYAPTDAWGSPEKVEIWLKGSICWSCGDKATRMLDGDAGRRAMCDGCGPAKPVQVPCDLCEALANPEELYRCIDLNGGARVWACPVCRQTEAARLKVLRFGGAK